MNKVNRENPKACLLCGVRYAHFKSGLCPKCALREALHRLELKQKVDDIFGTE